MVCSDSWFMGHPVCNMTSGGNVDRRMGVVEAEKLAVYCRSGEREQRLEPGHCSGNRKQWSDFSIF